MKQILSESERVIRFRSLRSSTTFASFISFSHSQYEKCFHPLICDSNQFWIVDAIWKFRKILNLIISQRIRPPVLKRPDESAVSVLIKKLNITKTGTPVFFSFFQVRGNRSRGDRLLFMYAVARSKRCHFIGWITDWQNKHYSQ